MSIPDERFNLAWYKTEVERLEDASAALQAKLDAYEADVEAGKLIRVPETGKGDLSDGHHTFNELYHHRAVLFSVICNANPDIAWKSKFHHDGTMYDGMFIVGINTPEGQATYHYDMDPYWDMFNIKDLDKAPAWDGHTPAQAIERIGKMPVAEWEDAYKEQSGVVRRLESELTNLKDDIEAGRLVRVPAPVGSKIYYLEKEWVSYNEYKYVVRHYEIYGWLLEDRPLELTDAATPYETYEGWSRITDGPAFLTREEAEQSARAHAQPLENP